MDGIDPASIRTGADYERERDAARAGLARAAADRRVALGPGLVIVFAPDEVVRGALEERLRADRVADPDRVAAEAAAFAGVAAGAESLAAVLFVDSADPVELRDRLADLDGVAERVALDIGGRRIVAAVDEGDESGALRLVFALDTRDRERLHGGADVAVVVDHPTCRAHVALSPGQVRAVAVDLRG